MLFISHDPVPYSVVMEVPEAVLENHIQNITMVELRNDVYSNVSVTYRLTGNRILISKVNPTDALCSLEIVHRYHKDMGFYFMKNVADSIDGVCFNFVEFNDLPTARNLKNYLKEGRR